jgi:hypothetical protein
VGLVASIGVVALAPAPALAGNLAPVAGAGPAADTVATVYWTDPGEWHFGAQLDRRRCPAPTISDAPVCGDWSRRFVTADGDGGTHLHAFLDPGLTNGVAYEYRVRTKTAGDPWDDIGAGPWSNVVRREPGECFAPFVPRAGNWPGPCWQPYSHDKVSAGGSPFNQVVPAFPRLRSNSAEIVQRLIDWGNVERLAPAGAADTGSDWSHPTYYARSYNADFVAHCNGDKCPSDFPRWQDTTWTFNLDKRARPAAGPGYCVYSPADGQVVGGPEGSLHDCHLTVVDSEHNWEVDFWQAYVDTTNNVVYANGAAREQLPGDGLAPDVTAGEFTTLAGIIRPEEIENEYIGHALALGVSCSSGTSDYPAGPGTGGKCSLDQGGTLNAPPIGARLQLDPAYPIPATTPPWKRTILQALKDFGAFVEDTGAGCTTCVPPVLGIGFSPESGSTFTSFGYRDRWLNYAERMYADPVYGADVMRTGTDPSYRYLLRLGNEWLPSLRVLDPCVTETGRSSC